MLRTIEPQVLVPADKAGFREEMAGVSKAQLWGDPEASHGNFTRFKAGYQTPMHTHTHDVRIVVISGCMLHTDITGIVTRLEAGSYCFIPGGMRHITACTNGSDCLFYEEQPGKFDLIPVR